MSEIPLINKWLYQTLNVPAITVYATGGIYTWPIPDKAVPPYILFQEQGLHDVAGTGTARIGVAGEWLVRFIAETNSYEGNMTLAARAITTILHAKRGSITGLTVWGCARVRPFQLVETEDSRQFRHLGGFYNIWASLT